MPSTNAYREAHKERTSTHWTGERIARLGFLVGLGWSGERVASDPLINTTSNNVFRQAQRFGLFFRRSNIELATKLPAYSATFYEVAGIERGISSQALIIKLLIEVASDPHLLDNILDDGSTTNVQSQPLHPDH